MTPLVRRSAVLVALAALAAGCSFGQGGGDAPSVSPTQAPPSGSASDPTATPSAEGLPQADAPLPDDEIVWRFSSGSSRTISTVSTNGLTGTDLVVGDKNVAASLSPDRRTVLYLRKEGDDRTSMRAVSADGQSDRRLFSDGSTDCPKLRRPALGTDGTIAVVCSAFDEGDDDFLNIMTTDGTLVKRLDEGQIGDPTFSPDGSRLVYARDRYVPYQYGGALFTIPVDGSTAPVRVASGTNANPVWSPAADEVAFVRIDGNRRRIDIARVGADGRAGGTRALTTGDDYDQDPSWSPDGTRLAFRRGKAEPHLYLMGSDGGSVKRIVKSAGSVTAPVWTAR